MLKKGGIFGMIIPSTILNNLTFTNLRKFLLDNTNITQIVNLGGKVFKHVNNDTLILLFGKESATKFATEIYDVPRYGGGLGSIHKTGTVDLLANSRAPSYSFELRVTTEVNAILNKMEKDSIRLGEICDCFQGLVTGSNEAYIVSREQISSENLERKICKPVLFGDDIARYGNPHARYYVIYLTKNDDLDEFPRIRNRLQPFKRILQGKREVRLGRQPWYSLHWPRERSNFERKEKILVQSIRNLALKRRVVATLDTEKQYADHTLNVIYPKDERYGLKYILAILNSKLLNYLFQRKYVDINIKGVYLEEIPIRSIDFQNKDDLFYYDKLTQLVGQMLALDEKATETKSPEQRVLVERQLNSIDNQIDELVYDIYQLDKSERDIVNASL